MRASAPRAEKAAATATRYGKRALVAFRRAQAADDRRERMRNLYEAERLRCQALAHALLSPDSQQTLSDLARLWEAEAPGPHPEPDPRHPDDDPIRQRVDCSVPETRRGLRPGRG